MKIRAIVHLILFLACTNCFAQGNHADLGLSASLKLTQGGIGPWAAFTYKSQKIAFGTPFGAGPSRGLAIAYRFGPWGFWGKARPYFEVMGSRMFQKTMVISGNDSYPGINHNILGALGIEYRLFGKWNLDIGFGLGRTYAKGLDPQESQATYNTLALNLGIGFDILPNAETIQEHVALDTLRPAEHWLVIGIAYRYLPFQHAYYRRPSIWGVSMRLQLDHPKLVKPFLELSSAPVSNADSSTHFAMDALGLGIQLEVLKRKGWGWYQEASAYFVPAKPASYSSTRLALSSGVNVQLSGKLGASLLLDGKSKTRRSCPVWWVEYGIRFCGDDWYL